jgi:thiamine-phosphate pyrophosphorylase
MTDVRLIVILDAEALGGRDGIAVGRAAADHGATALQLRMKHGGAGDFLRVARELVRAVAVPVYINDRADVAQASRAAGLHVGADDLSPERLRALLPGARIGISVGSPDEAARAAGSGADYWSTGPVYRTANKPDAGPALGARGFAEVAALAPGGIPVIGIGGITAERVPELCAAGAAGIAVIGAVLHAPDPAAATRRLRDALDAALGR